MIRIALASDIHVDFIAANRRIWCESVGAAMRAEAIDVVVIAGDVSNTTDRVEEYLKPLAVGRMANLIIPGNHDAWLTESQVMSHEKSSRWALAAFGASARRAGFTFLPDYPEMIGGWGFCGIMGWFDYSFADRSLGIPDTAYAANEWRQGSFRAINNDGHFVRFGVSDPEMARLEVARMSRHLDTLGATPDGDGPPIFAISHMIPYRDLVDYDGDAAFRFGAAFMGTPLLGALYDAHPSVRAIAYGHTHRPFAVTDGDGRAIVASPFGYAETDWFPPFVPEEHYAVLEADGRDCRIVRARGLR